MPGESGSNLGKVGYDLGVRFLDIFGEEGQIEKADVVGGETEVGKNPLPLPGRRIGATEGVVVDVEDGNPELRPKFLKHEMNGLVVVDGRGDEVDHFRNIQLQFQGR